MQGDVPHSLGVDIFPLLNFLLVFLDLLITWQLITLKVITILVQSYIVWTGVGEDALLALQHEEAFHGMGPCLVVWASEDGDKSGEAGQHVSC